MSQQSIRPASAAPVELSHTDTGCVRVVCSGALDARAAVALRAVCSLVLEERPRYLDVDLCKVTRSTGEGINAVTRCLLLGRRLEDGVGITVATDAGRRALLDSLAGM